MQNHLAASPMGIAKLSKLAFDGADLQPLWRGLVDRYIADNDAAAALMDLATIEQFMGDSESGLARQREALSLVRLYRSATAASPSLRLLALAAAGDIGTNTPLEFLLDGSDIALETLYVVPGLPLPDPLPDFDIAIAAAGESDENRPALAAIAEITRHWPQPVLNRPAEIAELARDRLAARLQNIAALVMPPSLRLERAALARLARGETDICTFPLIARPVDSHAGRGLEKLADGAALRRYLAERREHRFFVSPFIDYAGADGHFRKYRIAFIDGRPFACHMAIADQWMIYYLNAGMREAAWKRDEEARFMENFDADFARRHEAALGEIAARVRLDYFAIDCAETREGALLVFEADIAMIVHDMDPPDVFPYKRPQMQKLFAAFRALVKRKARA